MPTPDMLIARLDAIGASLAHTGHGLALIALGSVGLERERLDQYSDLDFFAIVETGCKSAFLASLDWLSAVRPLVYQFRNTQDGYKVLFDDGIFGEFAVFEPHEVAHIPFAPGRIVWKQPFVDEHIALPNATPTAAPPKDTDWHLGEALTNLYVGLCRYHRGEKLSAARFIQHYAVDRVIELTGHIEDARSIVADPFTAERRYEQRFVHTAQHLPQFIQGYERSPESAQALLEFLERHFAVNTHIAQRIRALCLSPEASAT